jgi:two-component system nitrogen regulation sensor histidine kinase GlnL
MSKLFSTDSILDSMTSGVCVVNTSLELLFMNQTAESIFGKSFRQMMNQPIDHICQEKQLINHISQAIQDQQGRFIRNNTLTMLHDGRTIQVNYAINPWFEGDALQGVVIEFHSLDRQIRIEKDERLLRQQKTNQSLLQGLAHEIKNPLGGLRGAAQLLESEFSDLTNGDELTEYTNIIIAEADRLKNLVDRMLGSTNIYENGKQKSCVNIHEILEHVKLLVSHDLTENISLSRDYDPSLPSFVADREQLIQVVLNIVSNAAHALKRTNIDHKQITLKTRIVRKFTINQTMYPLMVLAEIIDNGPGIPLELQDKLFFPMISGRADGTGLGLSIAQSLINQHNGIIEFDSSPGMTRFRILIPVTGDCE